MNDRDILEAFNEKADTLKSFDRMIEAMNKIKVGIKNPAEGSHSEAILEGPDKESIHACILNIRFFMQNNEEISIYNLNKVYERLSNPKKIKFKEIRQSLNTYLDAPSSLSKTITPRPSLLQSVNDIRDDIFEIIDFINSCEVIFYTNREIFDAFIYGDLSHMTKRAEYQKIHKSYGHFSIFVFWTILRNFMRHVFDIQELNSEVLRELSE
ncbi:hypothetical protein C7271_11025 [filamentous cyanobacterium CCP5]|nr:hypothetical protein C7271_11025 [filamentous cyanobacterium CCP5]